MKVYLAGKLTSAAFFAHVREKIKPNGIEVTSRWIDHALAGRPESEAREFWQEDLEDVAKADALICYAADTTEILRGALVETGAALALGKYVCAVGPENPSFGTWQHHPRVVRYLTMAGAVSFLLSVKEGFNRAP
jgi:nucleoside 2-deoxyribosyltransferase